MKKRISLAMALIMVLSLCFGTAAAAADIIVPEKVLLSHDFTQDTAVPEGWNISSGTTDDKWGFDGGVYISDSSKNLHVSSTNAYDAAGGTYSITVNHSLVANWYYDYFAIQDNSRYYVEIAGNAAGNRYVMLKKTVDGTTTELEKSASPINSSIWNTMNAASGVDIKIVVGNESLDIYVKGTQMISYDKSEGYVYDSSLSSGKVRFSSGYNAYKLYSVSVVSDAAVLKAAQTGASVEFDVPSKQLMSHDFTQDTELPAGWEEYKADDMTGYSFDNGLYITQTDRVLRITSPDEYNANGKPYTITVNHTLVSNGHKTYFAIQESSKYYLNITGSSAHDRYAYLYKVANGETTLLAKSDETVNSNVWADADSNGKVQIKIAVGLESIDVYVKNQKMISYPNVYDSSVESGKIAFENGYQRYKLYDFNIVTDATTANINDFILNKTFSASDTEAELEAVGWNVTLHSQGIDADAIPATSLSYNANISGNYTVEAKASKKHNNTDIYLRYDSETKNGYMMRSRLASGQYISFGKVVNGTYEEAYKVSGLSGYDTENTKYYAMIEDSGENVKLTLRIVYGSSDRKWEWTDEKSETNEPIKTAGMFRFDINSYSDSKSYVSYIKVYPTEVGERTLEDAKIRYYIDNEVAESLNTTGTVYLNMPTAILGEKFMVVAALYDSGVMKAVKVVDIADAYELTGAELFEVSEISENSHIAAYIWSGTEMVPIAVPSVLN